MALAVAGLLLLSCQATPTAQVEDAEDRAPKAGEAQSVAVAYQLQQEFPLTIQVTSTSIKHTGYLQKDFTCEGGELSPQLTWTGVPAETQSIAVVVDDIDAEEGALAHWLVWGVPADVTNLGGGISGSDDLPVGAVEGTNGYGGTGWKGPCPPPRVINFTRVGNTRGPGAAITSGPNTGITSPVYQINVYALDVGISALADADREQVLRQIDGHVIAGGSVSTKYLSSIVIRK